MSSLYCVEREVLYSKADVHVDISGQTAEQIVQAVHEALQAPSSRQTSVG